ALLDQVKPRLVAVGTSENPDTLGLALVAAARGRNLATLGLVDAPANAWVRFRGRSDDALHYCPDSVAVPDPATRDEFIKLGLASDRIAVTGHPHWDEIREFDLSRSESRRRQIRNALPGCDNNAKVVTFAAELSSAVYPAEFQGSQDYTLRGSGKSTGR